MNISLELVPRNEESLRKQLQIASKFSSTLNRINIPDLLRFKLRSWEACQIARDSFPRVIPHLRAMDFDAQAPSTLIEIIENGRFDEIVLIKGDPPQSLTHRVYPTNTLDLLRILRERFPNLRLYTAFDPYRQGLRDELIYAREKLDAGASGFFTQPFFDLRLMEICAEQVDPQKIYWGVSPVMTEKSKAYWEATNRAVFPTQFRPTLDWNASFLQEALAVSNRLGSSVYIMPIRIDLQDYLNKAFEVGAPS